MRFLGSTFGIRVGAPHLRWAFCFSEKQRITLGSANDDPVLIFRAVRSSAPTSMMLARGVIPADSDQLHFSPLPCGPIIQRMRVFLVPLWIALCINTSCPSAKEQKATGGEPEIVDVKYRGEVDLAP